MMPGIRLCYSPNFSALPFQLEAEQVCFDFSFGIPISIGKSNGHAASLQAPHGNNYFTNNVLLPYLDF